MYYRRSRRHAMRRAANERIILALMLVSVLFSVWIPFLIASSALLGH